MLSAGSHDQVLGARVLKRSVHASLASFNSLMASTEYKLTGGRLKTRGCRCGELRVEVLAETVTALLTLQMAH